jgi:hypothetical protein
VAELPDSLELALTAQWLPDAVRTWLTNQSRALPCEIRETANSAEGHDLTHYLTPTYALGTASRTYTIGQDDFYIEHHSNYLMLHYAQPAESGGWGMMYSRYVVNDQHWGTKGAAPDRSKESNFYDFGHFAGVQLRNKAIGLYALQPQAEEVCSLKTVVVFPRAEQLEAVWVDGVRVHLAELPRALEPGRWVVVTAGAVHIGIWPLEPSRLGREAQVCLELGPQGELWLTIYNYRGPAKRFWDYASLKGAFWHGNIRAGFIVEVADRNQYPSADELLAHLRQTVISDHVDERHLRTVTYRSAGDELALDYDLWYTRPGERRLNGQVYQPPALDSPLAVQGSTGTLRVGGATLITNPQPVWLVAQELDSEARTWVAVNPLDQPTPLRWETPVGVITATSWGLGRLELRAPAGRPELSVETLAEPVGLQAPPSVVVSRASGRRPDHSPEVSASG